MTEVEFRGVWVRIAAAGKQARIAEPPLSPLTEPLRVVVLEQRDEQRALPIWMGAADAFALLRHARGIADGLPVAAAVMAELVEVGGGRVDHVAVTDVRENAYRSVIRVQAGGRSAQVNARVSDALNLAVRVGVPILVDDQVMREVACPIDQLPEHLEVLHRAGVDTPVEPGEWRPLSPDLISELKQPATR